MEFFLPKFFVAQHNALLLYGENRDPVCKAIEPGSLGGFIQYDNFKDSHICWTQPDAIILLKP